MYIYVLLRTWHVQVSELRTLTEARGGTPLPDLMSPAISVLDAVQNLANVGQRLASGSSDEVSPIDCYTHFSIP